jgi:CHAT domain-containing protein
MALSRCLCLTLIVWMLGLRPSAGTRTGSPEPGSWWGTPEAQQLRRSARDLFAAGNYAASEPIYQRAYALARRANDAVAATRLLVAVANARFSAYRYRDALSAYLEARRMGLAAGDLADVGAIEANLATLYLEMWDVDSALHAAEQSLARCALLKHPYFEAALLVQLGQIHDILADGEADRFYAEGIEAARRDGNVRVEARAWDYIGENRLHAGDLASAERDFNHAYMLRRLLDPARLAYSWGFEGALKLAEGDFDSAAHFTDRAIAAYSGVEGSRPLYLLIHQRGAIRMARGDRERALEDYRTAVDLALRWREQVPPSIASLTATDIGLERAVFDSFIQTAAEQALRDHDSRWLAESLAAVAENRGASLRKTLAFIEPWRTRLRPEYWELQAKLRAESARLTRTGLEHSPLSAQLSFQMAQMEAETKLQIPVKKSERISSGNSLIHFQLGLSSSEVLRVFHLGKQASYLWAVTREQASLHRLPAADQLRREIGAFRDAVRSSGVDERSGVDQRGAEAARLGSALYGQLFGEFGELGAPAAKRTWLVSADDALFDLPFAALVTERNGDRVKYLVEEHALELIPDAEFGRGSGKPEGNGWFLGVGDPIYNRADERLRPKDTDGSFVKPPFLKQLFSGWTVEAGADPLARLAGSGTEVAASAGSWSAETSRPAVVLRGEDARRTRFLDLAARGPSIIHLATHVLTPPRRRDDALIAFSGPEFLAASEVASMHVPGALVVLSGCETGAGIVSPGAGLLGLTRAWQMAGASAVIATSWPVADSTGAIFTRFYRDLNAVGAAEALTRSKVEMIRHGGWRSRPQYWAAYQLSGGAR